MTLLCRSLPLPLRPSPPPQSPSATTIVNNHHHHHHHSLCVSFLHRPLRQTSSVCAYFFFFVFFNSLLVCLYGTVPRSTSIVVEISSRPVICLGSFNASRVDPYHQCPSYVAASRSRSPPSYRSPLLSPPSPSPPLSLFTVELVDFAISPPHHHPSRGVGSEICRYPPRPVRRRVCGTTTTTRRRCLVSRCVRSISLYVSLLVCFSVAVLASSVCCSGGGWA